MSRDLEGFPHEVVLMLQVIPRSPVLLPLKSWSYGDKLQLQLLFEYCKGGDLLQFQPREGCGQPEMFVWHVFVQIAGVLALIRESLTLPSLILAFPPKLSAMTESHKVNC